MAQRLRSVLFSLLLGFHNAWAHDDAALEEVAVHIRLAQHDPLADALSRPARCFFWNASSLLN